MNQPTDLSVHCESWRLKKPFIITGYTYENTQSIVVTLRNNNFIGRGEAVKGIYFQGENNITMQDQIESIRCEIEGGITRAELQNILPHGGARNAIDCALWDLEAKQSGKRAWELYDLELNPVETSVTLGIETNICDLVDSALQLSGYKLLKIKLNSDKPIERLEAIRKARPDARLVIDVNQGWSFDMLKEVTPFLCQIGVEMIEQPLPRDKDHDLDGYKSPIPLCADESFIDSHDLKAVSNRYKMINIKLDKCGGLTEALKIVNRAKSLGLDVMVGCMCGSSLAMAPHMVLAQFARYVDLDGPLMQRFDRVPSIRYNQNIMEPYAPELWG